MCWNSSVGVIYSITNIKLCFSAEVSSCVSSGQITQRCFTKNTFLCGLTLFPCSRLRNFPDSDCDAPKNDCTPTANKAFESQLLFVYLVGILTSHNYIIWDKAYSIKHFGCQQTCYSVSNLLYCLDNITWKCKFPVRFSRYLSADFLSGFLFQYQSSSSISLIGWNPLIWHHDLFAPNIFVTLRPNGLALKMTRFHACL